MAGGFSPDCAGKTDSLRPAWWPGSPLRRVKSMMTRVLIIEDEKAFATLLKQSLEKEGFSIEWAANLNDGQARAESGDFDVVLTDLYLPEGTAMNLTDRLHETNPQLPVIAMTPKHTT